MQNSKCKITIQNSKIVLNEEIKDNYFRMAILAPFIAKSAKPGQFINIKVSNADEPLLRRPFSIHRIKGTRIEILYEVLGKGTEILSQRKVGEYLDIIGPLGNGFDLRLVISDHRQIAGCRQRRHKRQAILVAGGMGVAPLMFLAEKIAKSDKRYATTAKWRGAANGGISDTLILIGAKTKKQILCEEEFKDLGCQVKIATDDGSRGLKDKVTDLLKKVLRLATTAKWRGAAFGGISDKRLAIYACGPRPMLKEIANISQKYNIPAQISLEEHMACGIGACLGCVVNTKNGYQRVCKEGPVFAADEIVWKDNGE